MKPLATFLQSSPTPRHAVETMEKILLDHHFSMLSEGNSWELVPGNGYFVKRQPGAIIAFILPGPDFMASSRSLPRINLVCAHTDSPGLRLKP
ncbi:MAG: M18 family aminopeptidase, partial [Magnetococcales bacterium]|nr:M18 family aminopeptidase [Magnetococcales bacterium]